MSELQSSIGDRVVTLVALRVDGRKMSISIFRQIPRFDCLDAQHQFDPSLKPWGRVIQKIANEGTEWLLAEREGQLVRCCLDLPDLRTFHVDVSERSLSRYEVSPGELRQGLSPSDRDHAGLVRDELRVARADLAAAKLRHEVLIRLNSLPQLFLG